MNFLDSSLLTILLTLAATFLGLSVLVQVIQELYKYLRSSKLRAYLNSLQDFLGPLAFELMKPGVISDIRVRGPFQLRRIRPKGMILPLNQEELVTALEKTSPAWIQRTLNQLKLEVNLQAGESAILSNSFKEFLDELGKVEQGTTGYWNALEITDFLKKTKEGWKHELDNASVKVKCIGKLVPPEDKVDAKNLLLTFSKRFIPHVDAAAANFSQFEDNFEYTYARSNRRLTFIIALLMAFCLNYPIDELYKKAKETDPATAINLAESTIKYYNKKKEIDSLANLKKYSDEKKKTDSLANFDSLMQANLKLAQEIMGTLLTKEKEKQNVDYIINKELLEKFYNDLWFFLRYLFGCIVTAIFVTFGAPFWNDIASALLKLQKGRSSANNPTSAETANG